MTLPITSLFASILAVMLLVLTYRVIIARSSSGHSILHGEDMDLAMKIRIHGNFVEFVPMAIVLLALAEASGASELPLYVAGALLVVSRFLIPFGMHIDRMTHPLRIAGNMGTHLSIVICIGLIAYGNFF